MPNARAKSASDAPSAPETRWYGYEPALTDGTALGLMYLAVTNFHLCLSFDNQPPPSSCNNDTFDGLAAAGVTTYLLAPPVIHALHGHWDKAGLSLGMRAAPLLLAWGWSARAESAGGSASTVAPLIIGGMFAAAIIDDAWLSREPVPPRRAAWYAAPSFDMKDRAASLVVAGAF